MPSQAGLAHREAAHLLLLVMMRLPDLKPSEAAEGLAFG